MRMKEKHLPNIYSIPLPKISKNISYMFKGFKRFLIYIFISAHM